MGSSEGACWGADDGSPPDRLTVATSSSAQPSLGAFRLNVFETKQQETTEQGEFEDRKLLIKVTSAPSMTGTWDSTGPLGGLQLATELGDRHSWSGI